MSPRRAPGLTLALLALALWAGRAGSGEASARRSVTWAMHTMGTYAHVILVTADSAADAPRAAIAESVLAHVDSLMSNWTATSEVARLNRTAGHEATVVEPEVATVVDSSLELWRESDGAFDITVEPLIRAGLSRRAPAGPF